MSELVHIGAPSKRTPPPSASASPADVSTAAGPPVSDATRQRVRIEGMHCTNCALGIERHLRRAGFESAIVDFSSSSAEVPARDQATLDAAIREIASLGYEVTAKTQDGTPRRRVSLEIKLAISALLTLPLLLHMVLPFEILHDGRFQIVLATPVVIIGVLHFGASALRTLRAGVLSMDVLVFIGVVSSYLYSVLGFRWGVGHHTQFFETAASIVTFVLLGNFLEKQAVLRTTSALEDLGRLQQTKARRVIRTGDRETFEEVDTEMLGLGDLLLVNSGDRIPVDGEIESGDALVDESMVTGESIPVERRAGGKVIGGTLVDNGSFTMRATAVGSDTVLSNIMRLVVEAQRSRPRIQRLCDRVSAVFIPVVLALATLTFLGCWFVFGLELRETLLRTLAVLVIACPCAMGLATPTAIAVAVGRAAKKGILVKGSETLELIPSIRTVVFDKTGTLTTGEFRVSRLECFLESEETVARLLVGLERRSSHPIARSIVKQFSGVDPAPFESFEEIRSWGVRGTVDGRSYQLSARPPAGDSRAGEFSLYLVRDGETVAALKITDEPRPEAAEVVRVLKQRGMRIVLVSGDRKAAVESVGAALGIEECHAETLPEDKAGIVRDLRRGGPIMFVGDGVNDAPALEQADLGVAFSTGTQIAAQSARIVLLGADLSRIPEIFALSFATLRTIKQNLFWAFFYNVIAIPVAAAGLLRPTIAALVMALSDLFVIGNSLRLRFKQLRIR